MPEHNDNFPRNSAQIPARYQPAFAMLSLDTILEWSSSLSEEEFCEKMRQEISWQSTEPGFRNLAPTQGKYCHLSRHIRFNTRAEWLWIAHRCHSSFAPNGHISLYKNNTLQGISSDLVDHLDRKAAAGGFEFIKVDNPEPSYRDQTVSGQLVTNGGFFVPTDYMSQERLQHALRQDPHALLLTPQGSEIVATIGDRKLQIYSMAVTDDLVEVLFEDAHEIFEFEPYQVYHAVHTRGQDVNKF